MDINGAISLLALVTLFLATGGTTLYIEPHGSDYALESRVSTMKVFYVVFNKHQSDWLGAEATCREYIPGGSLACITNEEEQELLDDYLTSLQIPPDVAFWVGGFRMMNEFRWVETARPLNYTYWADYQPKSGRNCITVQRQETSTFQWILDYCSHFNWILCQNFKN